MIICSGLQSKVKYFIFNRLYVKYVLRGITLSISHPTSINGQLQNTEYLKKYAKKVVETEDFKKCLEEESGLNLTKFFDQVIIWFH